LRVHFQFVFANYDPKIVDFFLFEGALLGFKVEVVFLQGVEDMVDMVSVSLLVLFFAFSRLSFRVNGQVVHVHRQPSLRDLSTEDHVHHHLEGSGGVSQPKEHNRRFEESFGSKERCLPFVAFFDADVVVSPSYIEFGEEGAPSKAVDSLRYKRGYITVLLGPTVNQAIVLDWAELPVFLFDEEEVGSVGAPRFSDSPPC